MYTIYVQLFSSGTLKCVFQIPLSWFFLLKMCNICRTDPKLNCFLMLHLCITPVCATDQAMRSLFCPYSLSLPPCSLFLFDLVLCLHSEPSIPSWSSSHHTLSQQTPFDRARVEGTGCKGRGTQGEERMNILLFGLDSANQSNVKWIIRIHFSLSSVQKGLRGLEWNIDFTEMGASNSTSGEKIIMKIKFITVVIWHIYFLDLAYRDGNVMEMICLNGK